MDSVYFLVKHYPFWAGPLAYILFELANSHRKRGHFSAMAVYALIGLFFFGFIVLYVFQNGYETAVPAVKKLEYRYLG